MSTQPLCKHNKHEVLLEQLRVLYAGQKLGVGSGIFLGAILIVILRDVIALETLLGWFAVLFSVALIRLADLHAYNTTFDRFSPPIWLTRFRLGVYATATVWASSSVLLFPAEDIWYQVFLGFTLAGLGVSVAFSYAVDMACAGPFFVAVIAPFMVRMFLGLAGFHPAMLLALAFFFGIVLLSMRRIHHYILDNTLLRLEADGRADKLEKSERRFRQMFERPLTPMLLIDTASQRVVDANAAAVLFYQIPSDELRDMNIASIEASHGHNADAENLEHSISQHRLKNGELRDVEVYSSLLNLDERELQFAIVHDVTERLRAEKEVHTLAFYDPVTQLPNRRKLLDILSEAMRRDERFATHSCLMFIDLDHFKNINDTQGHEVGDKLLIEVARRLRQCLRESDVLGRLGGDEFVVLLEGLSHNPNATLVQAEVMAEKIRAVLAQPYCLDSAIPFQTNLLFTHYCTASLGVTLFAGTALSASELFKRADVALYQAKSAGRNTVRFFDPLMQTALERHAQLGFELREAILKHQFELHYQMQVDSAGRQLGAETLLRWRHPKRGLENPDEFIAHVEESGMIVPLGLWVLRAACEQLQKWQQHERTRHLILAVNVSAKQFRQADFVRQTEDLLLELGVNPARLKLELTESAVLESIDDTIDKMQELRQLGVSLALDDFGTGHSSLQYLKRLPLDQIKIDQSFVRDLASDANDAAIVQAIIAMSRALAVEVIAEGVETEQQKDFLLDRGCHVFQGYLFGKPMPIAEFEAVLANAAWAD